MKVAILITIFLAITAVNAVVRRRCGNPITAQCKDGKAVNCGILPFCRGRGRRLKQDKGKCCCFTKGSREIIIIKGGKVTIKAGDGGSGGTGGSGGNATGTGSTGGAGGAGGSGGSGGTINVNTKNATGRGDWKNNNSTGTPVANATNPGAGGQGGKGGNSTGTRATGGRGGNGGGGRNATGDRNNDGPIVIIQNANVQFEAGKGGDEGQGGQGGTGSKSGSGGAAGKEGQDGTVNGAKSQTGGRIILKGLTDEQIAKLKQQANESGEVNNKNGTIELDGENGGNAGNGGSGGSASGRSSTGGAGGSGGLGGSGAGLTATAIKNAKKNKKA